MRRRPSGAVDRVYVMCMFEGCQRVTLPDTLRGRAFTVNGAVLKLLGPFNSKGRRSCGLVPDAYVGNHGHEVSLSHAAAIAHANAFGAGTAAFLEADSVENTYDTDKEGPEIVSGVARSLALPKEQWNVLRLGWRSRFIENYNGEGCAGGCSCRRVEAFGKSSKMCLLDNNPAVSDPLGLREAAAVRTAALPLDHPDGEGGGGGNCDIRGSESYVLHSGSFELVHSRLTRWIPGPVGTPWSRYDSFPSAGPVPNHWLPIIDYGGLQGIPKQILTVPLVSLQYEQPDFMVHQDQGDHEQRSVMQSLYASRFGSLCSTSGAELATWVQKSQAWKPTGVEAAAYLGQL